MNWEHIITVFLAAIPATIAAISSLKNGKELKRHGETVYTLRSGKPVGSYSMASGAEEWHRPKDR